ncbi:MAG TPA: histidine kinase dimerization/phospho-acceptor domain-containing protein [Gammaproteobacteria bacterium]|nr:histidine kinase dimerization/phospho-acceptor domain-containing protein [Gammaproteobacteria bacterium]
MGGFTVDVIERFRCGVILQEVSRCKGEFLAPLAHGLRNPLAPLRTSLELMGRRQ